MSSFKDVQGGALEEELSTGPDLRSLYRYVVGRFAKCKSVRISTTSDPAAFMGTGKTMKIPSVGRRSQAFTFSLVAHHKYHLGEYVVVFEAGPFVSAAYEIDTDPSLSVFEGFAGAAAAKASSATS